MSDTAITVVAKVVSKPEKIAETKKILTEMVEPSRADAGLHQLHTASTFRKSRHFSFL